jgi:WD40 repeat protein
MIDSLGRHQDLLGSLPSWTGRAVDVAVSGDGGSVVALRDDGTGRLWHPNAPDGVELEVSGGVGVAVSDDGTTVAVVTSRRVADIVALREITLFDVPSGQPGTPVLLAIDFSGHLGGPARLSFRPGSRDVVLVHLDGTTMLFDPAIEPPPGPPGAIYRIGTLPAAWVDEDRLVFVGAGEAFVARPDGSEREDVVNANTAVPKAVASAGGTVAIGYADGSLGILGSPLTRRAMLTVPFVHPASVDDVAVSADGLVVVSSASDGSVSRFATVTRAVVDVPTRSTRPTAVAVARGPAEVLVMAVDERVERRSASLSWAAAFSRRGVVGPPTATGGLLTATPTGQVLDSPERSLELPGVELPAVVSADGSTLVMAGSRPRVGPVASIDRAAALDVPPDLEILRAPALTPTGGIAAIVGRRGIDRLVLTFDGRTGAVRDTIEIPRQSSAPFCCPLIGNLLVSDEAVVIGIDELDISSQLHGRIEIHPHVGGPPRTIVLPGGSPMWLTSGPDAVLYVAGGDGVITAFPIAGGEPFAALDVGPADHVTAIGTEISGGQLMVVGYASGRVELWNLQTGALITETSRHSAGVVDAVIGQTAGGDLRVTTTAHDEGVVRTLDDADVLRGALCALAERDLSEAEWRRYVGAGDPQSCDRGL